MVTYKIIYDITQDAYNWYNSLNNFGGIKKLKNAQDIEVAEKIMGLNFSEAKKILFPTSKKETRGSRWRRSDLSKSWAMN